MSFLKHCLQIIKLLCSRLETFLSYVKTHMS